MKNLQKISGWAGWLAWLVPVLYVHLLLIKPHVAGYLYDAGMYLSGAKSIALGEGYRISWQPGMPAIVKYPPLFPLLLAPVWALFPSFPANVVLFEGLNILFMLGALALLFRYCRKTAGLSPWLSFLLVLLTGLNARMVTVTLEIFSEPLFLLLLMVLLSCLSRLYPSADTSSEQRDRPIRDGISLGLLCGLLFYARTAGLLIAVAVMLWLLLRRANKTAFAAGACFTLSAMPWLLWSRLQPAYDFPVGDFLVRTFNQNYFHEFAMILKYEKSLPTVYLDGFSHFFSTWAYGFFPVLEKFPDWVGLLAGLGLLLLFLAAGLRAWQEKRISPVGVILLVYLAAIPLWAFPAEYPRLLLVVLPFLWILLFQAVGRKFSGKQAVLAFLVLGTLSLSGHLLLMAHRIMSYPGDRLTVASEADYWEEFQSAASEVQRLTQPEDVLWTSHQPVFYALYTGRRFYDEFIQRPGLKAGSDISDAEIARLYGEKADVVFRLFEARGIRYIITNPEIAAGRVTGVMDLTTLRLLQRHPDAFEPVYTSPRGLIRIYRRK